MQENKTGVLFKTKGGHKEGMGDVTSSIALAEEFRNQGFDVRFIINDNKSVIDLVSGKHFEYAVASEAEEIKDCLRGKRFDITILNQLNTPEDDVLLFRSRSSMLVTIEDTGIGAQLADLRFNVLYPIDNSISDFKFIPLASVFQDKHHIRKPVKEKVKNIVVTQGGSDTYGFTPKIIKALYPVHADIDINVVIGPNFLHNDRLNDAVGSSPRTFNVIKGSKDISGLMLEADMAISAGGNTLFELACLGVPAIVICAEFFEVETADRLQKEGFGINLGFGKYVDEKEIYKSISLLIHNTEMRVKMSVRGKSLIDGQGAKRVTESVLSKTAYNNAMEICKKRIDLYYF